MLSAALLCAGLAKVWELPPECRPMANKREPILEPVLILSLRPTQMTVGMREVGEKRKRALTNRRRRPSFWGAT